MKSISVLMIVTAVFGASTLFGCGPRPYKLKEAINYEWIAVSEHDGWEVSKRADTFRTDAWKASYRIERHGYFNFTCRALPPPEEGVSGISYSFEPLAKLLRRPDLVVELG